MAVEKYASKGNLERFKSKYDDEINGKIASAAGPAIYGTTGVSIAQVYDYVSGKMVTYLAPLMSGSTVSYYTKSISEAVEGDLVFVDSDSQYAKAGIYVIEKYATTGDYSFISGDAFIIKSENGIISPVVTRWKSVNATVNEVPSGGSTGQILTKKSSGYGWANAPTELPSSASGDAGKVLTVGATGDPEWDNPSGGGSTEKIDLDKSILLSNNIVSKTWTGLTDFNGSNVWTDGENIYYSNGSTQYVLDKATSTWTTKTWTGLTNFYGNKVWTDGDHIYYSDGDYEKQYVLNKATSTWTVKTWSGTSQPYGENIWTDGDNIYYGSWYVLNKSTSTWESKSWSGLSSFTASRIWTDGDNIYYSSSSTQYVLDKSSSTWSAKVWNGGLSSFNGDRVWTDGNNIYYSSSSTQYVLDKATSTWYTKSWTGLTSFNGINIWTDGDHIYYSSSSTQYVFENKLSVDSNSKIHANNIPKKLPNASASDAGKVLTVDNTGNPTWNTPSGGGSDIPYYYIPISDTNMIINHGLSSIKGQLVWSDGSNIYYSDSNNDEQYVYNKDTHTWTAKTWSGFQYIYGEYVWTDGKDIYYSEGTVHYVLNRSTSTWTAKTFYGLTDFYGEYVWTDGENIYYSQNAAHYVYNKSTSTWTVKTWTGLTNFQGRNIWTDGENIYHSAGNNTNYVLDKSTSTWTAKTWSGYTNLYGRDIWSDGVNIYYSSDDGLDATHKVLDKSTSTWSNKTWNGYKHFQGRSVWSDGTNLYANNTEYSNAYVFVNKSKLKMTKTMYMF